MRSLFALGILLSLTFSPAQAQQSAEPGPQPIVPHVEPKNFITNFNANTAYPPPPQNQRPSWVATKTQRGTTVTIPEQTIIDNCSGLDGCIIRMGMINWDDTGRVASRHFLFYYNKDTKVWRAEFGDSAGTNNNNVTEHVANVWACYFTDGQFLNWVDQGDKSLDFGLLSWNQYNADCSLVIVR
jgi:hypothetical protein